jgi:ArsR family metal-binding transcriptional regulator
MSGYHLQTIPKREYGEISKIEEELLELKDAMAQENKIMAINELSDIIGAIHGLLERHFPTFYLEDLLKMSVATERAFKHGDRLPKNS